MLALAHEIVRLIAEGTFEDQAHAARALGFTRARVTQLVDLTLLAPEIQEEILFAEVGRGRDGVSERALRELVRRADWGGQREGWRGRRPPP
jgi:ParB-like chromosome segregation protein Spo0J